jgi:hypothetical protein
VGFIGYMGVHADGGERSETTVRIFLECRDETGTAGNSADARAPSAGDTQQAAVSYSYAVDVVFPPNGGQCRIRGIEDVLALKKFYKLVHSLEERAREHGHPREQAMDSVTGLLEHLGYTRNARDLTGVPLMSRIVHKHTKAP